MPTLNKVKTYNRRDTLANWNKNNPVLAAGEIGVVSDSKYLFKIGDGTSKFSALSFPVAEKATILETARKIGNASFNGSADITLSQIGAAASAHTHNYAGSSSAGGAANSVKTNLIIKLNGGSTEGTDLFTFNGSTAKTINITPSAIGAAASSHTHTKSQITDFPATLKNPTSIVVKLNGGTTEGTNMFTYDGSAAKTINITPGGIGAATSGHTHSYAGSSSVGGAANSVANALTISLNGTSQGGFNGSEAKSINITPSAIGAAASSHTHTKSQITDFPTSLKNPNSMIIKLNGGSTEGTNLFTYDGSANKSINITPSAIGASASGHTHNYAGSSSAGGAATSAVKLTTARNINGTSFDGTGNITTANWGTARNIKIGDTEKSVNGSANYSWTATDIGFRYEWDATITCATWSRLCFVWCNTVNIGSSFILSIQATRMGIVYNSVFAITIINSSASITRLNGDTHTSIQLRVLVNNDCNCYVEMYDDAKSATSSTTQPVYCRLIPISIGSLTMYTAFTSGATVPSGYTVSETMTTDTTYHTQGKFKGSFSGSLSGTASNATKVGNSLAIKLNGGTTEDTNLFTFNGSAAKTINITPSAIGAAASSHTHTKSQITDFPSSLKNPTSMVVKLNGGTTEGTNLFTYDGSAAKTVNITPAGIGASASGHTHNYAGSSSAGGAANSVANALTISLNGTSQGAYNGSAAKSIDITPSAIGAAASSHTHTKSQITDFPSTLKNPTSMIVKLNGGSTEGTDLFTYDGSIAKTINITPAGIGAAASSHNHTKSQITDFPTTLKNPNSMVVKLNGGNTEGTNLFTYDGGTAKTINITPAAIGASASGHTHSYAGSSSAGGAANSVANALTIKLNGTSQGAYNGSAAKSIDITPSAIGAAASSHTHTKSQITDFPSTLKNPNSMVVKLNGGSTEGTNLFTYDGSAAKSINITPGSIGAAASSHTHDYLPLTGGTVTGITTLRAGYNVHNATGTNGTSGYVIIAQFKISSSYQNSCIILELSRRSAVKTSKLYITFANVDNANPGIGTFKYDGEDFNAYLYKSATSTWDLYVAKSEAYDEIDVLSYHRPVFDSGIYITWKNVHANTVPSGATKASLNNTASSVAGALTISLNGTSQGAYNGSAAKSINITPSSIGAAASSHTHNYAGSSSAGGAANSVANALTIKLNGGSTEGSNLFTFNGSGAKTINITPAAIGASASGHTHSYAGSSSAGGAANSVANALTIKLNGTSQGAFNGSEAKSIDITPSSIGAAASSHTHTKSQITDFPTTLKNPTSIVVKLNGGATEGTNLFTYDGGTAKTINITPAGIGAATSGHTHNYAGSSSAGGAANSVANALTIKLNGTSQGAFNGSEAKSIDITPSAIGAAASSHTHTKSQITDFPTTLKNPNSIVVKLNGGSTEGSNMFTYDGSAAKSINITPSGIGAAASSHTHNYAGSSSAGGAANSVANALTLQFNGTSQGTYNGSAAKTFNITPAGIGAATSGHTHTSVVPVNLTSEDLNTIKPDNITFYYAGGSNTVTNNPFGSGTAFGMIAYRSANGYRVQDIVSGEGQRKTRYWNASEWSSWLALPTFTANPTAGQVIVSDGTAGGIKSSGYTIAASVPSGAKFTDTVYTHPTSSGNKHIPSGGSSGQILRWSADGTAVWGNDNNTTYSAFTGATASAAGGTGLVPAPASGANTKFLRGDATWVSVTPALIGAAASSHSHNYAGSSSAGGAANSVANALTVQFNGTSQGTYNGSAAKTFNITPAGIGAAASSHTHNYAGSSSAGGAANSVKTNLVVKLNGGSTEDTNLFTFNGGTAKTINITASSIGAATSSHTHTKSQITDFPTTLKNPTSIVVKLNGGSNEGTNLFTYDGSTAKTINITPSGIGAAASSHSHNYAGSSSAGGAANSVANALTIKLNGTSQGDYNGSAAKSIDITASSIGAAASSHTHNYAGSSSAGGAANSVKTNLVVKLNGGTTEDTNLFTFNGGTAKTINITPSAIGAAASSHTHTKSQITDFPTSLKNPNSMTVKLNGGTTEGTNLFTYDGSAGKTINITPAGIGASASGHTHNYAGSPGPGEAAFKSDTIKTTEETFNDELGSLQYFIPFGLNNGTGYQGLNVNDGVSYYTRRGGSGYLGHSILTLGNNTAEGTNGNRYGSVRLYGTGTGFTEIRASSSANGNTIYLPSSGGTLCLTSHTHNYAGSSSAGGAANSVANSLTIQLASGSTEGTDKFTFNGSANKSLNITAGSIGAAYATNGTLTWKLKDETVSVALRRGGASPTFGLNLVYTDANGNNTFHGLVDHTGARLWVATTDNAAKLGAESGSEYYGITVNGSNSNWLRTTSSGILPYEKGDGTHGHGSIGTSAWYFKSGYIQNLYGTTIYESGTALSDKYAPKSHSHSYLPLSGGTLTGNLTCSAKLTCNNDFYANANIILANNKSIQIYNKSGKLVTGMVAMTNSDNFVLGNSSYITVLRGSSVKLGSSTGTAVTSDKRLKQDVSHISQKYIDAFMDLDVVNFRYIKSPDKNNVGLIYQDAKKAFEDHGIYDFSSIDNPKMDEGDDEDIYGALIYDGIQNIGIELIQKHEREVNELKDEISKLRDDNNELRQKLDEIQELIKSLIK